MQRYAIVGVGSRSRMFYEGIAGEYRDAAELVGFCDVNCTRMEYANLRLRQLGYQTVPIYGPQEFERLIREGKPDVIIVCTIDRTHHQYINKALEMGVDVITEKPLTVDEEKCQSILDTVRATGRRLTVALNYRYAPQNSKLKEILASGVIGRVHSVHFEWLLDIKHGADYFRRWHRDKRNSGGLLVHKSTHHFDLVNFWLDAHPKTVYAMGDLNFYGRENAENRGLTRFYTRAFGSDAAREDPFALHLERDPRLKAMYLEAEKEDGYYRDMSVFADGISIEDTMGVLVRFANRTILTYSLVTYAPYEGYYVALTGDKGRIELAVVEQGYLSGEANRPVGRIRSRRLTVFPMFGNSYPVEIPEAEGGHGGADPIMLKELFLPAAADTDGITIANHLDGARSVLVGIAANKSLRTGCPVEITDLVHF